MLHFKDEEINKGNKVFYGFMDGKWKPVEEGYSSYTSSFLNKLFKDEVSCQEFCDKQNRYRGPGTHYLPLPETMTYKLRYHTDWEWLMAVINKVESLHLNVQIEKNECYIFWLGGGADELPWLDIYPPEGFYVNTSMGWTKIQATWLCLLQFVEWYNAKVMKK